MLASHYAPNAPVELLATGAAWPTAPDVALLAFTGSSLPSSGGGQRVILSPNGDLNQAATHLFACLRQLDATQPARIVAELVPEIGLGEAINDRLRRAAGHG